jgi:CheY-like chemotaxis protein
MRQPGLPEPIQKGLSEIQDACHRATRLTRKLLAFSRKHDSRPVVLDPNRAITHLAPLLKSLLGDDIVLKLDLRDDLGLVEVDEGELGQIIMNLVVNARDAMHGSGTVYIETGNVQHHRLLSGTEIAPAQVPHVLLSVRDTGCGMNQEVQSRIFEPFFTTKDVGKGTGLGLSTVYAIVTNASGQLSVESKLGEGSAFHIFFPRAEGVAAPAPSVVPQTTQSTARETILLVEDDDRVRDLILAILRPLGYRLIAARNATEAVESWHSARRPVDLLLTDIRMPGIKGTELAQTLRKEQPALKVLFISGQPGMETPSERESLAGSYLLAKPFSPDALAQKVREVLGVSTAKESVLIVDDDAKIRDFLRSVLEAQGYLVQETSDGREALSKIAQNCPDVVLTDIVMPDVEGIELIRMIRKVTPNLRIIAMSGASDGYLHAARALGADATIQKPIDIDALLALMLTLFSPHSARQTDQRDLDRSPAAI